MGGFPALPLAVRRSLVAARFPGDGAVRIETRPGFRSQDLRLFPAEIDIIDFTES